ncbi:cholesterol oxidase [Mangrovactinospora gilvigrisea]|uniref:Cholesterol oxidase n=1 Tax=Mangrovactinospora gilvigrisea TaxID=1428644 RepID=A0A1J7BTI9_9ACTN|nr:cholesterol oxidase [Mangrovactinospora gilvigrisea]
MTEQPAAVPDPDWCAEPGTPREFDVVVVGSGFGGAVTALRLAEKGYRVAVLEAGRRFTPESLPATSWDLRGYLWAPRLGLFGIQRIHQLKDVMILAGAGVGGGSLNYANTLYQPPEAFFRDPQWAEITDWSKELDPYYAQARRMLGVRLNPTLTPADRELRAAADRMGVGDTFHMAPVGVFFGDGGDADGDGPRTAPGEAVDDPYFGGAGPRRRACIECGECMTGCRHGAKNTLNENYLYLAEKLGATVHPMTTVERLREVDGGYAVDVLRTGATRRAARRERRLAATFRAPRVVLAAGTWGTQTLLHRMRDEGLLPRIPDTLGRLTRTNSEALLGARTRHKGDYDFTRGVAITSSVHPDGDTHIEPVRYGRGSNAMALLESVLVRGDGRTPRILRVLGTLLRNPSYARALNPRGWSEQTVIALVMQSLDNSVTVSRGRGGRLTSRQGHGAPNPDWIPAGHEAVRHMAEAIDGWPGSNWGEIFHKPLTAHFLGGCPIGADQGSGVVDPYHRLYGHPGISVVDGSAVSANLGVNPSLTITAQAERAAALWPNKGEPDPRPAPGAPYRDLSPTRPHRPAVPDGAFAGLRLPYP